MATFKWYGNALLKMATGQIDFDTDTFKLMLATAAYTPDQDAHQYRSSVTNEVAASGSYAAGGATLTGVAVTYDAATNQARVKWNDVTFTGATITARTVIIYKARGGASTADELVAYATETADVSSTAADFTVDLSDPTLYITAS